MVAVVEDFEFGGVLQFGDEIEAVFEWWKKCVAVWYFSFDQG